MKALLEGLLPRLYPKMAFVCLAHEGKADLDRSFPRKLRAIRTPGTRFVILRDQDHANCLQLKDRIRDGCRHAGREDTLVRIACRELEAWYLGDLPALEEAFGMSGLTGLERKARFRDPDAVQNPAVAIAGLVPGFQKVSGARRMGRVMCPEENRSHSFRTLIRGLDAVSGKVEAVTQSEPHGGPPRLPGFPPLR